MTHLNCSLCRQSLLPDTRWRIPVDVCSGCGAIWFDAGEFGPYLRHADQRVGATSEFTLRPMRTGLPLVCPTCAKSSLTAWEARGIELFGCSHCHGVLLSVSQAARLRTPRGPHFSGPNPDPERSAHRAADTINAAGDAFNDGLDLLHLLFPQL